MRVALAAPRHARKAAAIVGSAAFGARPAFVGFWHAPE
jgi:hypothetical protein